MAVTSGPAAIWRVGFTVPEPAAAAFNTWADGRFATYSAFELPDEQVRFDLLFYGDRPDEAALGLDLALVAKVAGAQAPPLDVESVPDADWRAVTYAAFPPVHIGRFVIHGSHHADAVKGGALGLQIDAATAFGTGEHPTTEGCILALDWLARSRRPARLLDLGCGTGILAMAMVRLWRRQVIAVDIDAEAVRVTAENAVDNGMRQWIRPLQAERPSRASVARHGPFDLIAANILARPLIGLSRDIALALRPNGTVVLSGLLDHQAPAVLAWFRLQGLVLVRRFEIKGWATLVLRG